MRLRGIRPGRAAAVALFLALAGCGSGQPGPAQGHEADQAALRGFGWFHPGPAPGTWRRASLAGQRATLSYPGSLRPMRGDPGTVTVGSTSRSGAVLVYLNVTPRRGDETLRDWPSFRVDHLREEGQTGVRVDDVSPPLDFRGGRGRCVIDKYTTKVRDNHYREIACYVQGTHAAAVRHALDGGIADLSLRQIAATIGTSHRMLIYHFGSREGLLVAVTQAVEEQQRAALLESGVTSLDPRTAWQRLSDPALWPQERLFFELYAYALRGRPGTEGFLDGIVESWVAPIAAALVEAGADEPTARADARLSVAVVRGLLLDLLATGDRAGTTAAYERLLQLASAAGPSTPSGD